MTTLAHGAQAEGRMSARITHRRALLVVLAGTMLLDAVEVSSTVVALPSVAGHLQLSMVTAQALITGFALGFGATLVLGGRMAEAWGRQRVYLVALVCFAVASVVAACASDPALLIGTRIVKGCCAALTAPTGLAIIVSEFSAGAERERAVTVYTTVAASGFATGLLLAGVLTPLDWRWTFAFPAPVALALAALGARVIPAGQLTRRSVGRALPLAAAGGLLSTAALIVAVSLVPSRGWLAWPVLLAVALAAGCAAVTLTTVRRSADPLLRTGVLGSRALVHAMIGAGCLNGSYLGLLLLTTVRLQEHAGWTPVQTAAALLPASLPLVLTSLLSGRLIRRVGTRRLIAAGCLLPPVAYVLYLARLHAEVTYTTDILPAMLLLGAAFVLGFAALNVQATAELPVAGRPAATGIYQSAVQAAAALVPAVIGALIAGADRGSSAVPEGWRWSLAVLIAIAAVGALAGLTAPTRIGVRP